MASLRPSYERPFGAGSLLLSLGLHLALVAFVLASGWLRVPTVPSILEVNLVGPAPGGDSASPGPASWSAPAPAALKPAAKPAPPPHLVTETAPKPVPPKQKKRRQRLASPSPEVTASTKTVSSRPDTEPAPSAVLPVGPSRADSGGAGAAGAAPAGGSAPGPGRGTTGQGPGGQGNQGGGSGGLVTAQTQYLGLVRARILAHRFYPPLARARRMEGVVRLRFTVSHTGALSQGVQVVKPSGFSVLDEQASQCVLAAAPFPPFPPELRRKNSLTVEVPIVYELKGWSS